MVDDTQVMELESVNIKMAQLSWRILRERHSPYREEQVKELSRLKEQATLLRNLQMI
jgi:hypothetical protein